ncbi:MAG: M3 family oligoendopeptidase [Thermoleophilaceae bacterium]|nr:M3 family oligoendopeptidase [Thermoleophilaceae bacterium]
MTDSAPTLEPDAVEAAWDLEPLVDGEGEPGVERLLDLATARARAFAERHEGRVAELDGDGLEAAMGDLAEIQELAGRAGSYAMLWFSTDTRDPPRGALVQRVQERGTEIETALLFFELEWAGLPDERAEELLATDGLDFCRHYLRTQRRYRPHLLSQPEERVLAEKRVTGESAWARLFSELVSAIEVDAPPERGSNGAGGSATERVPLDAALSRLTAPDREIRRGAAEAVTTALAPGLRTRGYLFNTLLHDKAVDDRLRGYGHWLASRNLANEASDESVQALVEAVRARFDLPKRWYRLKAELLGIDRIADYDRMAPVVGEDETMPWPEARELVLDAYGSFSPELGRLARGFFDDRRIDAPLRPGKRGGAFCAYTVPSSPSYVMLNWTSKRRDALTLAHELGHGVHADLGARQGVFHHHTPLTLAETASVFGEEMLFARLLEQTSDPASRLALLAGSIEDSIATVFRQTAMNQFEDKVHSARREDGELPPDRFGELWIESQAEMLGDSVELTEGYATWWSYIPHFIHTPGYVYAYAYGQLLALSVYERYLEEGESFVPRYLEMLSAGGSRSPEELGRIVGVDLADPGFWDAGLALVERQLEQAEAAAREVGGNGPGRLA